MSVKLTREPVMTGPHFQAGVAPATTYELPEWCSPMEKRTYLDKYTGVLRYQMTGEVLSEDDTEGMSPEVVERHRLARKSRHEKVDTLEDFKARMELTIGLTGVGDTDSVIPFLVYACNGRMEATRDGTLVHVYKFGRFAVLVNEGGGKLGYATLKEDVYDFTPPVRTEQFESTTEFVLSLRGTFHCFGLEFGPEFKHQVNAALLCGADSFRNEQHQTRYCFGEYEVYSTEDGAFFAEKNNKEVRYEL